ncbi:MAG: dihydroorotate dehydrogenase electron transfer subunit [Bacteroidales bacterium]|jgi:dihydroorotate dehydrogenase electron transfer subunit|nr:dihydroorotate dehydrogenase electron transfer subunit [Bacteroidales bacterium]
MKKYIDNFIIAEKRVCSSQYFVLVLKHPSKLPQVLPGQFVEVEVKGNKDVYLRRPISVHDVDVENNTLSLLVQIVGKGTTTLSMLKEGDSLSLVYPLGKGFSVEGENPLLVGGGCGLAPLLYAARCYSQKGVRPDVLLGGRTADLIPIKDEFKPFANVFFATEDGSLGEKGLVTQHPVFLSSHDRIVACGPNPMMKAVARYANEKDIACEVSLENSMACGIGACLCCVADTDKGHKCVCKEGPVFDAKDLTKWSQN